MPLRLKQLNLELEFVYRSPLAPEANFEKITVFENLNLVLKQGEEQKVAIESGEFLLNDISVTVEDNRLIVRNENGCNLFRDYGLSTVYVTSPNINEIRSSTGLNIASEGTLVYPSLRIISESFNQPEADTTSGSFDLNLDCDTVVVLVNGISFLQLSGQTQNFNINAAAGASRIEAGELRAEMVRINHRGSNDIIVNLLFKNPFFFKIKSQVYCGSQRS